MPPSQPVPRPSGSTSDGGTAYQLEPRRRVGCIPLALAAGGCLVLAVLIVMPSLGRAREPANRVKCGNNLRQIGFALKIYADGNGGLLPPDPATVLLTQEITADVFVCPSARHHRAEGTLEQQAAKLAQGEHLSYVYVGGGQDLRLLPPDFVLAYELPDNHDRDPRDGGAHFLFADLRIHYIPGAQPVIGQLRAGHNPPMLPAAFASVPGGPSSRR